MQIPEGAKPGDRITFPGLEGEPVEQMPAKRASKLLPVCVCACVCVCARARVCDQQWEC